MAYNAVWRHDLALAAAERGLELDDRNPRLWAEKAAALYRSPKGDVLQALSAAKRGLDLDPNEKDLHLLHGWALSAMGSSLLRREQFSEALHYIDAAFQEFPEAGDLWEERGIALQELGQPEEALRSYDRSTERRPFQASPWLRKAHLLLTRGRYQEALTCAERGLEMCKDTHQEPSTKAMLLDFKGNALAHLGRFDAAARAYREGAALSPQDSDIWHGLGWVLFELRRFHDAVDACQQGLRYDSRSPALWNNLGESLHALGHFDEALAAAEEGLASNPRLPYLWRTKAAALEALGRAEEAHQALGRATDLEERRPL